MEFTVLCRTALAKTLFDLNSGRRKTRGISTANENTSPSGPASIAYRIFSMGMYPGVPVVVGVIAPASINIIDIRVAHIGLGQGVVGSRVDRREEGIRSRRANAAYRAHRD